MREGGFVPCPCSSSAMSSTSSFSARAWRELRDKRDDIAASRRGALESRRGAPESRRGAPGDGKK